MTDLELLNMLREHPEQGCQCLLEQYTGLVLAICRKKLSGCCTPEDIEELVSDILFEFYQKREQISLSKGTIRGLLAVMAGRRCIDHYRTRRSGFDAMASESIEDAAETLQDSAPNPEESLLSQEQRRHVLDAIASLGEPDHEIFISKYYFSTILTIPYWKWYSKISLT